MDSPRLATAVSARISAQPGVRSCTASSVTGGVLVTYDPRWEASAALALLREQLLDTRRSPLELQPATREA
ncbi:MAG TPA: hypothetical protein VG273_04045, partial [Bryobacteraceae bacterium]|nr:hypothetical protein [Bryobacteraceae bacterium]